MKFRNTTLIEVASILNIEFIGTNCSINSLNLANRDFHYDKVISYIASDKYKKFISNKKILAFFMTQEVFDSLESGLKNDKSFFIVDDPEKLFYELHIYLYEKTNFYHSKDKELIKGENVEIHPSAIVETGVVLGDRVKVGPFAIVYKNTIIGDGCVIHAGAVIGSEGFQVIYGDDVPILIPHVGGVRIGKNVSIGANSTIANSLFDGYTEIGDETKIDALVFIAHNCKIGSRCVLVSGAIMAGSSVLEDDVWIAPQAVILNQLNIGANSFVGSSSLVTKNVLKGSRVFGVPAKRIGINK